MDKIIIKGLTLSANVGLPDKERRRKQRIIIDCEIFIDLVKAGKSDSIIDTINYSKVCNHIKEISKESYKTIEALAHRIAISVKEKFGAEQVKIQVKKPKALRRFKSKYAAVEVTR